MRKWFGGQLKWATEKLFFTLMKNKNKIEAITGNGGSFVKCAADTDDHRVFMKGSFVVYQCLGEINCFQNFMRGSLFNRVF